MSGQDAAFYAAMYRDAGLKGGHVILLNAADSPYFQATKEQALKAQKTYPEACSWEAECGRKTRRNIWRAVPAM